MLPTLTEIHAFNKIGFLIHYNEIVLHSVLWLAYLGLAKDIISRLQCSIKRYL